MSKLLDLATISELGRLPFYEVLVAITIADGQINKKDGTGLRCYGFEEYAWGD